MTEAPNPVTSMARNLAVAARGIWRLLAALLLIVALLVGTIALLDAPVGHRFLVTQLHRLNLNNGIGIRVGRIEGSLFSDLRVHDLQLTDVKGVFLEVPVADIDWRPRSCSPTASRCAAPSHPKCDCCGCRNCCRPTIPTSCPTSISSSGASKSTG